MRAHRFLIAATVALGAVAAIAWGAPAPAARTGASTPPDATAMRQAQSADLALMAALRGRITAARQLEQVTLAAIEQRLRTIYALPSETPIVALLAGDVAQAQAIDELAAAMTHSDNVLLTEYRNAITNLQIAQAELADNAVRINAELRIAAARRAARTIAHAPAAAHIQLTTHATTSGATGLPAAILDGRRLPGSAPVRPVVVPPRSVSRGRVSVSTSR